MSPVERLVTGDVQAVLFDLDGTLFDHETAAVSALRQWLPTVGVEATDETLERWFASEEYHVAEWRAGRATWAEQRRSRLRDVLPGASVWTQAQLDLTFKGYLRGYEAAWQAFDDVVPALDMLAKEGLRLAVLTNGATMQQRAKLDALGLHDQFEFVLTAEDLGVAKPDPEAYLAACRSFSLEPGEVLHVGDIPDLDVEAAAAAGLRSVLVDRSDRYHLSTSLRSLSELASVLAPAEDRPGE